MEPFSHASPGGARTAETTIDFDNVAIPTNLDFFNSNTYAAQAIYPSPEYDVSGEMNISSSGARNRNRKVDNAASRFLDSKGFGWLLESHDDEDEHLPLLEELDIDLKDIYYKVRCVLLPLPYFRLKLSIVRESPDFWGPLLVVIAYALLSIYGQFSVVSWILTMWFCGSFFVFFLARALGGEVGYSQVLGVVGYCLLPLVVMAIFYSLVSSFAFVGTAAGSFGVVWSVYSAGSLLCVEELEKKRPLLLYPVFLLRDEKDK